LRLTGQEAIQFGPDRLGQDDRVVVALGHRG
jgi:hypothetical protein